MQEIWYDSNNRGRWLSTDPELGDWSNPQRLNRYTYVLNDPVNYVDPDGRFENCGPMQMVCGGQLNPNFYPFRKPPPTYATYGSNRGYRPSAASVPRAPSVSKLKEWWRKFVEAKDAALEEMDDPDCADFLNQVLSAAREAGYGYRDNLTLESLKDAIDLARVRFGDDSHPIFLGNSDPNSNRTIWAVTAGNTMFFSNAFFGDKAHPMQTVIHESFHAIFDHMSSIVGPGLTDAEMARAAGVWNDAWDALDPEGQRNMASPAFTTELKQHSNKD